MIDDANECDCLTFKKLLESSECGQDLSALEANQLDRHGKTCPSCACRQSQHAEIAESARHLPQFDVSEGITQRILDSIEKQSTPAVETSILPVGLVAIIAFLLMVPFDSWQSLYGWGVGILGLLALQFLVKTANNQEQVI